MWPSLSEALHFPVIPCGEGHNSNTSLLGGPGSVVITVIRTLSKCSYSQAERNPDYSITVVLELGPLGIDEVRSRRFG